MRHLVSRVARTVMDNATVQVSVLSAIGAIYIIGGFVVYTLKVPH